MTSTHRRRHIATARELSRDLRLAATGFDPCALSALDAAAWWNALQLDAALVARFRALLEKLWFDGIRSRFFADFDASKLILPIACEIADRLDALVEELELQNANCEESASARGVSMAELRN